MSRWPMPETIPGVVLARGGWFAVFTEQDNAGSGPWRTKEGAEAALAKDYVRANELDRNARP